MEKGNAKSLAMILLILGMTGLNIGYTEYRLGNIETAIYQEGDTINVTNETVFNIFVVDGNKSVSLTSLNDYQIVHSKVVIDANLPDNIRKVEVRINDTFHANYLPYVWNNIQCPAGLYNISVHAWDENYTEYADSSLVEIPKFEIYTPANFTPHEDIVIHANQTVIWRDGEFDICMKSYYDNGLYLDAINPLHINVFGKLILYNVTLRYMKSIYLQKNGTLVCHNNTVFNWDDLMFRESIQNDYSIIYIQDYAKIYIRNDTKNIENTNLPTAYYAEGHSIGYRESDAYSIFTRDDATVITENDLSDVLQKYTDLLL